ncbi:MAG: endonuclease, partial [Bacteroidaceae bacterium]|nr:endonuclease [Bacteroidaceae bacterium]
HTLTRTLNDAFVESGHGLGISYHKNKFLFRIDNILVSAGLKTSNCTVDSSIDASDHYPIWAYVEKN